MLAALKQMTDICYMVYAVNANANKAEVFINLYKETYWHTIWDKLDAAGCKSITKDTHGLGDLSVVASLARIIKLTQTQDYEFGTHGTPDMNLLRKAQFCNTGGTQQTHGTLQTRGTLQAHPIGGRTTIHTRDEVQEEEFDIVKKKRRMEQSSPEDTDQSPEALAEFQAFIDAVWPAIETVCIQDERLLEKDLLWVKEQKISALGTQSKRHGFVYAAWNPCFPELIKIGATKRDTPYARLKELSGSNVPKPFELVTCLPSEDPFALEKTIHAHFKDVRILKGTRYCEFFCLTRETISEYFSLLF